MEPENPERMYGGPFGSQTVNSIKKLIKTASPSVKDHFENAIEHFKNNKSRFRDTDGPGVVYEFARLLLEGVLRAKRMGKGPESDIYKFANDAMNVIYEPVKSEAWDRLRDQGWMHASNPFSNIKGNDPFEFVQPLEKVNIELDTLCKEYSGSIPETQGVMDEWKKYYYSTPPNPRLFDNTIEVIAQIKDKSGKNHEFAERAREILYERDDMLKIDEKLKTEMGDYETFFPETRKNWNTYKSTRDPRWFYGAIDAIEKDRSDALENFKTRISQVEGVLTTTLSSTDPAFEDFKYRVNYIASGLKLALEDSVLRLVIAHGYTPPDAMPLGDDAMSA